MVHALERTYGLLKDGGILIEIHHLTIPPHLEVHSAGLTKSVGYLLDHSGFERLQQTNDAVGQAVRQGLFATEMRHEYEYDVHIDTLDSFHEWLDRQWDTSYLPKPTVALIEEIMRDPEEKGEIVVHRSARVTLLKSI